MILTNLGKQMMGINSKTNMSNSSNVQVPNLPKVPESTAFLITCCLWCIDSVLVGNFVVLLLTMSILPLKIVCLIVSGVGVQVVVLVTELKDITKPIKPIKPTSPGEKGCRSMSPAEKELQLATEDINIEAMAGGLIVITSLILGVFVCDEGGEPNNSWIPTCSKQTELIPDNIETVMSFILDIGYVIGLVLNFSKLRKNNCASCIGLRLILSNAMVLVTSVLSITWVGNSVNASIIMRALRGALPARDAEGEGQEKEGAVAMTGVNQTVVSVV